MNKKAGKVFVGMSGGVDSSVAAVLLQEEGYDVVGVFIKVWQADFLPCTWREERREAMRAAAHLNIPFLTLDLEKEYKEGVVDYMIREYGAGRVPNPDVICNKQVKFGAFLQFAKKHGADFIATGHYARIEKQGEYIHLYAGLDKEKDQSYFLWTLSQKELAQTLFPVGHLQKSEVRALAEKFGLPNAQKKDSQGLCFMGPVNVADFLKHYLKTTPGNVLNENGEIIGRHDGALLYTIGQRHGFTTTKVNASETPYFVIAKNLSDNTLTVAHRTSDSPLINTQKIIMSGGNFIAKDIDDMKNIVARIRYRGALYPVTLTQSEVIFGEPIEGVASGQSVVFYRDRECLGGGIVEETFSAGG